MPPPPPKSARRRLFNAGAALLGVAFTAAAVAWAIWMVDVDAARSALEAAQLWPWVPLAVVVYLLGQVVRGVRCSRLVSEDADLPLSTATNVVVVGYAVNNILPARLGEFARAGLLAERAGLPLTQSLAVTFAERLIDGLVILLYFAAMATLLDLDGWLGHADVRLLSLVFVAVAAVAVTVVFPQWCVRVVTALTPGPLRERVVRLAVSAVRGFTYLRSAGRATEVLLLSLLIWALEAGMFLCILVAFGLPPRPEHALVVMAITNLGILFPSTPGFIGTFHFFATQALVSLAVAESTALAYAVVVHLTFYIPLTAWGVGAMLWYGVRIGETLLRTRGSGQDELLGVMNVDAREPRVSAFLSAIVSALCPREPDNKPALDRFVAGQLAALPTMLRVALSVGLLGFRTYVVARTLRRFTSLPSDRQRSVAESWAYGRVTLARQLFRPLRSIVLFAYYSEDA